jgi:hypothetical protein
MDVKNPGELRHFAPLGEDGPKFSLPARWAIHISAHTNDVDSIKVAIGFDETLNMIEAALPFHFEFVASRYTALISVTRPDARLQVDVWSDLYGNFQKNGGFAGSSRGKLSFNPRGPIYSSSGTSF